MNTHPNTTNTTNTTTVSPSFRHAAELVYVLVACGAVELANARSVHGVVARLAELFAGWPMPIAPGCLVASALLDDPAVAELFAGDDEIEVAIEGVLDVKAAA